MTETTTGDLTRMLAALTDRQRLDFAYWAVSRRALTATSLDDAVAGTAANDAVNAFRGWRNDRTVSDAEGEMFFDPCFPQGWDAWGAAEVHVAAIAVALARRDTAALSSLGEALARIGLSGDSARLSM